MADEFVVFAGVWFAAGWFGLICGVYVNSVVFVAALIFV